MCILFEHVARFRVYITTTLDYYNADYVPVPRMTMKRITLAKIVYNF